MKRAFGTLQRSDHPGDADDAMTVMKMVSADITAAQALQDDTSELDGSVHTPNDPQTQDDLSCTSLPHLQSQSRQGGNEA